MLTHLYVLPVTPELPLEHTQKGNAYVLVDSYICSTKRQEIQGILHFVMIKEMTVFSSCFSHLLIAHKHSFFLYVVK